MHTDDAGAYATLDIDLVALQHNYRLVQEVARPAQVGGVVKANGYGLGAGIVAGALWEAGCRDFFVAHLGEASELRQHLPVDAAIYILNGLQPGGELACAAIGAIPALNSLDQIARWSRTARAIGTLLPAALQIDTGMARYGLAPDELTRLTPSRMAGIDLRLILSHLACANEPNHDANNSQQRLFAQLTSNFPGLRRSLRNSGGCFLPGDPFDLVRAGIALYGGAPHDGPNPMKPVVSLTTYIAQVRAVPAGTGIGYGFSHQAERPARIATIPVGYADGLSRQMGNRGHAFIEDKRVPMVGRISMDSATLDVTDLPAALVQPGTPVELIGPNQSIDAFAVAAGTIAYECLTQLGRRYHRRVRYPAPSCQPEDVVA
jgi:alanine racemase